MYMYSLLISGRSRRFYITVAPLSVFNTYVCNFTVIKYYIDLLYTFYVIGCCTAAQNGFVFHLFEIPCFGS